MNHQTLENLSSPEARGKRIRFVREQILSFTREEFCSGSNINTPSLKGWELGWGGGLTKQGAEKVSRRAKEFNIYCTVSWLMYGIGRPATLLAEDLDIQESDENHISKEILLFRELEYSVDSVVKDDSMVPLLYPGNYVGGVIEKNIKNAVGKECIVIAFDNNIYIRILKHSNKPHYYDLDSLNQKPTLVKKEIKCIKVKFAAPIIWIRRVYRESNL